jgi:hypothetical protein
MTKARTLLVTGIMIVLTALVATGAVATSGTAGTRSDSGNRLAGTWNVTLDRPAPLPPFKSLQVFTGRGAMIEMANESQASRTAQYGAWERIKGRLYAATGSFFRFDAQGNFIGSTKINRTIKLAPNGNRFRVVGRATVYDANGNVVASLPVRASGVRMQVERIPDVP